MLTHFRFDLVPKILYAKHREENINTGFALDLYKEHLRVWNGFKEYDNPDKNTFEKFKESFDNLLDSMKTEGFKEEFAVPVTKEGHLLNGAHRVAAAMTHKVPIKTKVSTNPSDGQVNCSSEFFRQLGLGEKWLDAMALNYALMGSGLKIITMFPARDSSKDSIVEDIINNSVPVVYKKTFNVNDSGLFNLISQLYFGEPWLSDGVDPLVGAKLKANVCRGAAPVKVFLVQSPPDDLKEKIRNVYAIDKHSAHINDTDVETQRIARIVFNRNSINFLNNFDPEQLRGGSDLLNTQEHDILFNPFNHFFFNDTLIPTKQDNISVLFLWKNDQRIIDELHSIGQIKEIKTVKVSDKGKYNLLDQIHYGKPWWESNLIPETDKRIQGNEFTAYVFTGQDLHKKIKKWKYETRNKLGLDKTYFHVSDPDCYKHLGQQCSCPVSSDEYNTESIRHINMIFHKNTFDFINQRTIRALPQFDKCLKLYRDWLPDDNANFCVDNGGVLGAYGIRDTHDVDFLCHKDDIQTNSTEFGCENKNHRLEYERLGYSIEDIITDPDNYFYHYGMKFMSLSVLKEFKYARTFIIGQGHTHLRKKDRDDYELINNFLDIQK